nr:hypothetical protein B0A51_08231 [Rachicladosporium sp. CCFEE 5018]
MSNPSPSLHFLTLPPEIREQVYTLICRPCESRSIDEEGYTTYDFRPALTLFRINRQIHDEANKVFYSLNTFARVETPWQQSREHLQFEGDVPTVIRNGAKFTKHRLVVGIDAPAYEDEGRERETYVVHADDLGKFGHTWWLAGLSHPALNPNLRLTLELRDPFSPEWETPFMAKAMQRKLLEPWGKVRGLVDFRVVGQIMPYASLLAGVKAAQIEAEPSVESCLSECVRLKALGNDALKRGTLHVNDASKQRAAYHEALDLYTQAWAAIHITIRQHQRHIHADAFYARTLTHPPYAAKSAQSERLTLRIQLVANTCLAYLKLSQPQEAKFWGMRTIRTLREAFGVPDGIELAPEQEAATGLEAGKEMGRVYYRTAVACLDCGERQEARRLLAVAKIYLPGEGDQRAIEKVEQGCALRVG